jgi:hypothetical protein
MLPPYMHLSAFVATLKDVSPSRFGTPGVNVWNMLKIFLPEQGNHTGMLGIMQEIKLGMKVVYM